MFYTFLFAWLFAAAIIYLWCYIVEVVLDLPITGQTPCTAHASLKNIIRRVLRDASNIAILKSPEKETEIATTTTNRTYEDLLATAILNKVIDNYQTDLRRSSSGSTSSKKSDSSKKHKHKRYDDEKWRQSMENPDLDSASMSSIEEWCRSESSGGSKYIDHMSFTIQQSIEEISTSDDDSPSNQYLHTHNLSRNSFHKNEEQSASREDWQDNWLFSRKGKSSPKPVPVPMLVPNPSTDFRALIGDRDAEDTTDLSETGSDLDETENEVQDIKSILVDSRTIIGGKNLIEEISTEILEPKIDTEEIIRNNVVKEEIKRTYAKEQINGDYENEETNEEYEIKGDYEKEEIKEEDEISEAKNNILIEDTQYPETDSLGSNTEKDAEYTEKYASFPRKISKNKSPVPSPRVSKNGIDDEQRQELIQQNNGTINHSNHDSDSDDEDDAPIVVHGSYSEKEREKWRNPIAMANNPYSKENLDKRLQSSVDGNYSFGRDYYVREATRAAGGRQKFLKEQLERAGHDFEHLESLPEHTYSSQNVDEHIFTATPAIIDEDTLGELTESIQNSRPISLALSTDSEDVDIKRVYNIETGKIYKYKPREITKEVIEAARSPEGTKSFMDEISSILPDTVDSKFDENHNEDIVSKEPIMNLSKMSHLITPFKIDNHDDTMVESLDEPDIVLEETQEVNMNPPEMRDSSIKYLLSLVKNNSPTIKMRIMSPPVQEVEYFTKNTFELNYSEPPLVELQENNYMMSTPPISLQENEVDEIDKYKNFQSCIDLRNLPDRNNHQKSFSNKDIKLVQEFSRSMSNLIENKQYYAEDNDEINYNRVKRTIDEEELTNMPSVTQLKKMFDQDNKSPKATVLRTKSHLTTKPEFRAHQQQIHSLTARSLSKDFRRELQKSTENSVVNGQDEDTVEEADELRDIPPCKAKIKYFELLGK